MQQCALVSARPWDWPHANNQNLPQNKVLLILSGKSRSLVNFTAFSSSYSYDSSPQMALFGHYMGFLAVCLLFWFKFIGSVQSLKKCYIIPYRRKSCYLGTTAWWWDWLFLRVFGVSPIEMLSFFFTVSISQCSALLKPLPPMTHLLLSHLWMFFKYCRQQEADSKMLQYLDRQYILKHHTHNLVSFFAALNFHTSTVKGVRVSFPFLTSFLWLLPLLTHTSTT